MIKLNQNYDQLKEQIDYIRNHILDCKSPSVAANYQNVYRMLVNTYYICTGKIYQDNNINKNCYASYAGLEKNKTLLSRYEQNYLENKSFHQEMFSASLENLSEIWNSYLESDAYLKLYASHQKPFDERKGEDIDILTQYFIEKDKTLLEIFKDLQKQNAIYACPDVAFLPKRAITIMNSVENKVSIFIPKNTGCNTSYLASIVHELGHVLDFYDLVQRQSNKISGTYFTKSIFAEVLSTEYQMDFYDFLMNNRYHEIEARRERALTYNSYLDSLEDASLYASLPDQYYSLVKNNTFTRKELMSLIDPEYEGLEDIEDMLASDFNESLEYSYGILLHPILSNDKKIKDQFMTIRHNYFDKEVMTSIALTPENVAEKAVEKAHTYFKS